MLTTVKDNEVYQEFRESTHEVNNHGSAQPLMSDVLEKREFIAEASCK